MSDDEENLVDKLVAETVANRSNNLRLMKLEEYESLLADRERLEWMVENWARVVISLTNGIENQYYVEAPSPKHLTARFHSDWRDAIDEEIGNGL